MKGTLLTGEEKKNINNEVARLRNFLQLLQFCRERERKGQSFSLDMKKVTDCNCKQDLEMMTSFRLSRI